MNAARSAGRSAANNSWNCAGSIYVKPSGVFFMAPDLARSLGKRFPSSDSFSPASGMWAAIYTKPTTDGSVPASVITAPLAVSDKNARAILLSQDALRGSHIVDKRRFRLLDDADVVAILDKDLVHASPARTVRR